MEHPEARSPSLTPARPETRPRCPSSPTCCSRETASSTAMPAGSAPYAVLLADALTLSEVERRSLETGAFLHDLGLLGVPDLPLGSALHPEEPNSEGMRHHPDLGARMVLPLTLPAEVTQIIAYHHERFDGAGYPHGLQGEGIPLMARIACLADGFDHLFAGLPAVTVEDAIAAIRRQAGSHFDPVLADAFTRAVMESRPSFPTGWPLSHPAVTPPR